MSVDALVSLLPLLVPAAAAVLLLPLIAFCRSHALTALLAVLALVLAGALLPVAWRNGARDVTPLLVVDGYALFFIGLLLGAGLVTVLLAHGYLEKQEEIREEFYVLLLLAVVGAGVLAASRHFASFFLGLELLSVSLYAMIAYLRFSPVGVEAGLKYLVLAGASSACLLFGMALIYAETGTLAFAEMGATDPAEGPLMLTGLAMLVPGIGFKLALVPFHLWTPDVYQGAPAPVTGLVATVSKGGVLAVALRYFTTAGTAAAGPIFTVLAVVAAASMLTGNLLALLQRNVKRILAYSSIAHLGYLLVAVLASGDYAVPAVTVYLAAYFVTTLGAFGVVAVLSTGRRDADEIDDYRGLFWRRPWLAALLTGDLLSLVGIPLTAGFIGKFYVVAAGVQSALWALVILLVVSSAISLYYYLRIVVAMWLAPETAERPAAEVRLPWAGGAGLAALSVLLLWLGIYPAPLLEVIRRMVVL